MLAGVGEEAPEGELGLPELGRVADRLGEAESLAEGGFTVLPLA